MLHGTAGTEGLSESVPLLQGAAVMRQATHDRPGPPSLQHFGLREALQPGPLRPDSAMARRHMSEAEVCTVDAMQKRGHGADEILEALLTSRAAAGEAGPSRSAVYRTMRGDSYTRGAEEHRCRRANLPPEMVDVAQTVRLRLLRDAKSEIVVTWSDIYKGTTHILKARGVMTRKVRMPDEVWFTKTMRAQTRVRSRHGKRRITHEKDYKARRAALAATWVRYPQSWWEHEIHAHIDTLCVCLELV